MTGERIATGGVAAFAMTPLSQPVRLTAPLQGEPLGGTIIFNFQFSIFHYTEAAGVENTVFGKAVGE